MARRETVRKRYSDTEKRRILAAAKAQGLTGAEAAKQFGISQLTFYRWRGPVRSDALRRAGKRRQPDRPMGARKARLKLNTAAVRREVQAQIQRVLPQIIREEVAAALAAIVRR